MNEIKCVIHDQSNFDDKYLGQPRVCIWIENLSSISNGYKYLRVGQTGSYNNTLLISFHKNKPENSEIFITELQPIIKNKYEP